MYIDKSRLQQMFKSLQQYPTNINFDFEPFSEGFWEVHCWRDLALFKNSYKKI